MARTGWYILQDFHLAHELVCLPSYSQDLNSNYIHVEVPVPTDFGLTYEDLPLQTSDGLTLRCYILRQRKELGHHQEGHVDTNGYRTDEEVNNKLPSAVIAVTKLSYSLLQRGPLFWCFTGMAEITDIAYLWQRYFMSKCAATYLCFHIEGECLNNDEMCVEPRSLVSYGLSDGSPSEKGLFKQMVIFNISLMSFH